VDYWAVGVLLFEQVAGYSPFADRAHNDQMVICKNILKGVVDFPSHFRDRDVSHRISIHRETLRSWDGSPAFSALPSGLPVPTVPPPSFVLPLFSPPSLQLQNLILQILVKDVAKRLGCLRGGAADIKAHPFFRSMDWDRLRRRELPAPWRPRLAGALDTSNFDEYDETDKVAPYSGDADWDAGF
jgi:serine/threonine protein kinase